MSRKSAYKQVLSIGTAVVLGFALFTGSLDGAPKLLSPQSDEQAAALAEKQNESPNRTDNEADLVARLESETASSEDSGDGSESATTDTADDASSNVTPIDEVENPDLNRARGVYLSSIPDYAGNPYVALRANSTHPLGTPSFTLDEYDRATEEGCFKKFSKLDSLGRTRKALACVGPESLGQGKRGDISRIHPAGWHQQRYDFIPGQSLYNRCHLIAWSLCGENANRKNLLTGTRYLNETGMLPFEEQILATSTTRATTCSTVSRPCTTKRSSSVVAFAWKHNQSRTTARPCAFTCTATTCSRMCRSTTPPAAIRPRETRADRASRNPKMIRFPPSPRDQIRPPRLPRAAFSSAPTLQTKLHATWRGPPHSARPAWPERHKAPAHSPRASW